MDVVLLLLVLVAVGWGVWVFTQRRRPAPPEDEWVLPPETPATPRATASVDDGPSFQVLDRDALVNPDRVLDPSRWDNTPDDLVGTDPDEVVEEAPRPQHFDRAWLERQREERAGGADA